MPDMLTIEKYEPNIHYNQLVECLQELQEAKSSYPPKNTVTNIQPSAEEWLSGDEEGKDSHRFVAMLEGRVVGHIDITALHDYMVKFLKDNSFIHEDKDAESYVEIGTFFVSPRAQKHGVGHQLFTHILRESQIVGKVPTLAVVESHDSHKATHLYERHGMRNIGAFQGTHGKNLIFIQDM